MSLRLGVRPRSPRRSLEHWERSRTPCRGCPRSRARATGDRGRERPFDIVVLAPSVGDDEAIALAEFSARELAATAVLLVRDVPVDGSFPSLVRGGVRDVVDLTKGRNEFRDALRRAVEWSGGMRGTASANGSKGPTGVVVAVFSTKGGTGKTFLAAISRPRWPSAQVRRSVFWTSTTISATCSRTSTRNPAEHCRSS